MLLIMIIIMIMTRWDDMRCDHYVSLFWHQLDSNSISPFRIVLPCLATGGTLVRANEQASSRRSPPVLTTSRCLHLAPWTPGPKTGGWHWDATGWRWNQKWQRLEDADTKLWCKVNSEGHGQNMIELSIGKYSELVNIVSESWLDQYSIVFGVEAEIKGWMMYKYTGSGEINTASVTTWQRKSFYGVNHLRHCIDINCKLRLHKVSKYLEQCIATSLQVLPTLLTSVLRRCSNRWSNSKFGSDSSSSNRDCLWGLWLQPSTSCTTGPAGVAEQVSWVSIEYGKKGPKTVKLHEI